MSQWWIGAGAAVGAGVLAYVTFAVRGRLARFLVPGAALEALWGPQRPSSRRSGGAGFR